MFLTVDEIEELTGYLYCSRQIKWLADHGYKFEVSRNGKPKVLKTHVEARLGAQIKQGRQYYEPDFSNKRIFG